MSNLPTLLPCKECGDVAAFYSSITQCFSCGTWLKIADSSRPQLVKSLKRKKRG